MLNSFIQKLTAQVENFQGRNGGSCNEKNIYSIYINQNLF